MNSNGTPPEQTVVEDACRAAGGNLIFCECHGKESDGGGDAESLNENCAFFLNERTLDVEWTGKSCSV